MSKIAVLLTLAALAPLPEGCTRLLGKNAAPQPVPVSSADLPLPDPGATTPPVYHSPEPPESGSGAASGSASPPSAEYAKARTAADAKDWKKVRTLLEKRVRGGKAPGEEAALLLRACSSLKDKSCTDYVHKTYPNAT